MMDSATAYEKSAQDFLNIRDKSEVGRKVIREWASGLTKGADVLELACGGGYPVTSELKEAGLNLWAIDSSETLTSEFCMRFPDVICQCERIQESVFFNKQFDAVIAIGLIFLLSESEQALFISKVSDHITPGGRFLFTAPVQKGTWKDVITGLECISLGKEMYSDLLKDNGFEILDEIEDEGSNNHYDVKKL